jgi:hypothetical protein
MLKKKKKVRVKVCSVCQKPGHNKSRCTEVKNGITDLSENHNNEVDFVFSKPRETSTPSQHIVNLQRKNLWENIDTQAPEKNQSNFYNYHQIKYSEPTRSSDAQREIQIIPLLPEFLPKEKGWHQPIFSWGRPKVKVFLTPNNLQTSQPEKEPAVVNSSKENKKVKKEFSIPKLDFSFKRALVGATLIALLVVAPLRANGYYQEMKSITSTVAEDGSRGFLNLQESTLAIMQADINGAKNSTDSALANFDSALNTMNDNYQILQKIASIIPVVSGELESRQNIITAGQKITMGNKILIEGVLKTQENDKKTLTEKINILVDYLNSALPNYRSAVADLDQVKTDVLPLEYQALFTDFKKIFTLAVEDMSNLSELGTNIQKIFGAEGLKRYLLVFQNPNEVRPTGGFIGSFAIMDVKDGQIIKMDIPAGGSYDLKGQLDEWVEPPTPLLLSNKRWEFQDANWFPDFPTSAEKMLWFYRHSRNLTADGVIAINATVLERLLTITGTITDEKRQLEITDENAVATLQKVVESNEARQDHQPKEIIAELANNFMEYFKNMDPTKAMPLMVNLYEALNEKEIQVYFTDTDINNGLTKFNWSGKIENTKENQDYLMVVNTNIQGQKSDARIKQTIEHQAVINDNGEITITVIVTREHTGKAGEEFYGQTNADFMRLYVSQGSQLISVSGYVWPHEKNFKVPEIWTKSDELLKNTEKEIGFEPQSGTRITEEFGKTAFGNWLIVEPGTTGQIQFVYKLPFKIIFYNQENKLEKIFGNDYTTSDYQLLVQKQSGVDSKFISQIIYPDTWRPSWKNGPDTTLAENGMSINTNLKNDISWGLLMRKLLN